MINNNDSLVISRCKTSFELVLNGEQLTKNEKSQG